MTLARMAHPLWRFAACWSLGVLLVGCTGGDRSTAGGARCRIDELAFAVGAEDFAGPMAGALVGVSNQGDDPCKVPTRLVIELHRADGGPIVHAAPAGRQDGPHRAESLTLRPCGTAIGMLTYAHRGGIDGDEGGPPYSAVLISLAVGTSPARVEPAAPLHVFGSQVVVEPLQRPDPDLALDPRIEPELPACGQPSAASASRPGIESRSAPFSMKATAPRSRACCLILSLV
jgi:hypothetical protein